MAYPVLADLKNYLEIDDTDNDGALSNILAAAIDYVEVYTNRNMSGVVKAITGEEYLADEGIYKGGECWFRLNKDDAVSITAISVVNSRGAETPLEATSYRLVKPLNRIYISKSFSDTDILKISYTYGTANTPDIIKQIILAYSRMLANQSENSEISSELITSERIGEHAIGVSASSDNLSSTKKVFDTQTKIDTALDQFRKLNIGAV